MSSDYEMKKEDVYPPIPGYSTGYPPNPASLPVYPPNPPGYPPNPSGPSIYAPNQIPTYSNVHPSYYGSQLQPGVIITTQPNPNVMVLPQPAYKDYFAWSVVNLIFCNLILGIAAVVFSSKTQHAVRRGDSNSAASYSHTAFSLNIAALVLGIIGNICWLSWVIYQSVTYGQGVSSYYNVGFYG